MNRILELTIVSLLLPLFHLSEKGRNDDFR